MLRLEHPRIYLGSDGETTDAILIDQGRVVATGPQAWHVRPDSVIRPDGECVLPGLIESHIHLWGLGLRAGTVSLRGCSTTTEAYGLLRDAQPVGGWILGRDWDQNTWTDQHVLELATLDAMFPNTPMCLRRVDGHALWANSKAMEMAGIGSDWMPPHGGDGWRSNGKLNGCFVDEAMKVFEAVLPPETLDDDRKTFLESAAMLRGFGITVAHKAWMPVNRLAMLEDLRDRHELGVRLHLLFDCNDEALDAVLARGPWSDDWISARGIKFFADGALGSRGAALHEPYLDSDLRGLVVETTETMNRRIPEFAAAGWQVAVHAIGDRAATNVLDAFGRIDAEDRRATRPRLEHAQMLTDDDVDRFGKLGVIASLQPIHMHSDAAWAHEVLSNVQLKRLFRWRDLSKVTRLAGGSDFPIEDPNPWHAMSVAMTRRHRGNDVFHVEQSLTRQQALALYLEDGAWAGFAEARQGQLRVGFNGDWCSLDTDPFLAQPGDIWNTRCLDSGLG